MSRSTDREWHDYLSEMEPPKLAWLIAHGLVDEWPFKPRSPGISRFIMTGMRLDPRWMAAEDAMVSAEKAELKRRVLAGEARPELNCAWEATGFGYSGPESLMHKNELGKR